MGKIEWHPITRRLVELEVQNNQLQRRMNALQLVVSWLLARQPDDKALLFLSAQANELNQSGSQGKWEEDIALLDELREDVLQWHAQWSSDPNMRRL